MSFGVTVYYIKFEVRGNDLLLNSNDNNREKKWWVREFALFAMGYVVCVLKLTVECGMKNRKSHVTYVTRKTATLAWRVRKNILNGPRLRDCAKNSGEPLYLAF